MSRKQRRKFFRWEAWCWRQEKGMRRNPIVSVKVQTEESTGLTFQVFKFANGEEHRHLMYGAGDDCGTALGCDPRTPIRITSE